MHSIDILTSTGSASRAGHVPGDIRDAFVEALHAALAMQTGQPEPEVMVRGEMLAVSDVCNLVWKCGDMLPRSERAALAEHLDPVERGKGSYSAAARRIKAVVGSRRQPRAARVPEEVTTLRDLRKSLGLTQQQVCEAAGYPADRLSRIESMAGIRLTTLDRVVGGLGGRLRLVVEFDDRAPVTLSVLKALNPPAPCAPRRKRELAATQAATDGTAAE